MCTVLASGVCGVKVMGQMGLRRTRSAASLLALSVDEDCGPLRSDDTRRIQAMCKKQNLMPCQRRLQVTSRRVVHRQHGVSDRMCS